MKHTFYQGSEGMFDEDLELGLRYGFQIIRVDSYYSEQYPGTARRIVFRRVRVMNNKIHSFIDVVPRKMFLKKWDIWDFLDKAELLKCQ